MIEHKSPQSWLWEHVDWLWMLCESCHPSSTVHWCSGQLKPSECWCLSKWSWPSHFPASLVAKYHLQRDCCRAELSLFRLRINQPGVRDCLRPMLQLHICVPSDQCYNFISVLFSLQIGCTMKTCCKRLASVILVLVSNAWEHVICNNCTPRSTSLYHIFISSYPHLHWG